METVNTSLSLFAIANIVWLLGSKLYKKIGLLRCHHLAVPIQLILHENKS